jgi:hypothetical protein
MNMVHWAVHATCCTYKHLLTGYPAQCELGVGVCPRNDFLVSHSRNPDSPGSSRVEVLEEGPIDSPCSSIRVEPVCVSVAPVWAVSTRPDPFDGCKNFCCSKLKAWISPSHNQHAVQYVTFDAFGIVAKSRAKVHTVEGSSTSVERPCVQMDKHNGRPPSPYI